MKNVQRLLMIPRVKGTQDFLDLSLYNFIIDRIRKHLGLYYFTEIATPILEAVNLFNRSLGLYTDVVTKEMFVISSTSDEELICLRPEATASTVRAFIEHHIQTPWKVFSHGPMFRYERPQKGRFRQFHQINIEIIGSTALEQDVQLIKMLDRFFHEQLLLNNYALLLNFLGCFNDRKAYQLLLKDFLEGLKAEDICPICVERKERNIMRVFDCKNLKCQKIYQHAPYIADYLCKKCTKEWEQVQNQLSLLSVSYAYQPTLVRGLDYYNKTVFEFVSKNLGAQNAFCGGGRYDQLVGQLGAKEDQPSLGAAIGIERLLLLLDPLQDQLRLKKSAALHVIMPLGVDQCSLALLLADELQSQNLCVDLLLTGDSLKSMMRKANKMGAAYALILGEEEQQTGTVTIKNMMTGQEKRILQIEVVAFVRK